MSDSHATELKDRNVRIRAQTEFDRNLVLTAGAGTGKTSLLTGRTIAALLFQKLQADEILITTFTDKAAAEMFERVEQALLSIAEGRPNSDARRCLEANERDAEDPGLRSRAAQLVEEDQLPRISTFHSYCLGLIRDHAKRLSYSPLARVFEEEERFEAFEAVWLDFLRFELGSLPLAEGTTLDEKEWREVLALPGLEALKELAWSYIELSPEKDIHWDEGITQLHAAASQLLEQRAGLISKHREGQTKTFNAVFLKALELVEDFAKVDPAEKLPEEWILRSRELEDKKTPNPSTSKRGEALGLDYDEIKAVCQELVAIAKGIHIHLSRSDTTALRKVCQGFQQRWREHCARDGILSHNDCLGLAHELLRDHPELCRKLGEGYKQILVDEFQDTDPLQYEILFLLGRDWQQSNEDQLHLRKGLFCIVGDPKQSIYRFRGADMTAFENALRSMEQADGERLDLSVNFRSTGELLDLFNETMQDLIQAEKGLQPDYVPLDAPPSVRAADGITAEFLHLVHDPNSGDKRRQEARMLTTKVREIAESRERLPDGEPPWRDIVYLFRASTEADLYAHELREAGIPVLQEGSQKFYERHEVERFLAFLRALIRPHDEAALVAWLRSPMVAAKDSELLAFVEDGGSWEDFYSELPSASLPAVLASAARDLDRLRAEIRNLPAHEGLAQLFHDGLLSPIEAAGYGGQQAWANLERLVHIVGEWSQERSLDLEEALDRLERDSITERSMEESPLADPGLNAVRILTAHKSKGLQFPVVVLPDLAHGTMNRHEPKDFILVRDAVGSRLLIDREPFQSPVLPLHLHREAQHLAAERSRLLYVAMTRAEDRLLLSYCDKIKGARFAGQPWAKAFEKFGFAPSKVLEDGSLMGEQLLYRVGEVLPQKKRENAKGVAPGLLSQRVTAWQEAKDGAQALLRPPLRAPSYHETDLGKPAEAIATSATPPAVPAAELGTLVHAYMASMQQDEVDLNTERLPGLAPEPGPGRQEMLDAAAEILRGFLGSNLARRFAKARILGRELPLLYRDTKDSRWQGSMDLVLEEAGEILVVDFKSDRVEAAQIPDRAVFYEDQLRIYAEALQSAWQLDKLPQRELWFLRPCLAHRF